jgi:ABC-2 type transport system ATP-binding protein
MLTEAVQSTNINVVIQKKELMSTVIEVDKLCKTYGDIKAVNNVSLTVVQGEIFGMLGPNGAGKTTTMEIVEGLRPADSGSVSVLGMDIKQRSRRIKASIGVQLQDRKSVV